MALEKKKVWKAILDGKCFTVDAGETLFKACHFSKKKYTWGEVVTKTINHQYYDR